jgi:hypothetical protein
VSIHSCAVKIDKEKLMAWVNNPGATFGKKMLRVNGEQRVELKKAAF